MDTQTDNYVKKLVLQRRTELQKEIDEINRLLKEEWGGNVTLQLNETPALSGLQTNGTDPMPGIRKRRSMSAKARKAISDAQKARWAAHKANKKAPKASRSGAQSK